MRFWIRMMVSVQQTNVICNKYQEFCCYILGCRGGEIKLQIFKVSMRAFIVQRKAKFVAQTASKHGTNGTKERRYACILRDSERKWARMNNAPYLFIGIVLGAGKFKVPYSTDTPNRYILYHTAQVRIYKITYTHSQWMVDSQQQGN